MDHPSIKRIIGNPGESHSTSQHVVGGVGFHSTSEKVFLFKIVSSCTKSVLLPFISNDSE